MRLKPGTRNIPEEEFSIRLDWAQKVEETMG